MCLRRREEPGAEGRTAGNGRSPSRTLPSAASDATAAFHAATTSTLIAISMAIPSRTTPSLLLRVVMLTAIRAEVVAAGDAAVEDDATDGNVLEEEVPFSSSLLLGPGLFFTPMTHAWPSLAQRVHGPSRVNPLHLICTSYLRRMLFPQGQRRVIGGDERSGGVDGRW